MKPVDTNRPGFQPLGCGSICTQGFALGWYKNAPLALEAIRRGFLGSVTTSAVALSVPRALPWAGIGARRWRLRPSAGCGFLGSVTTSAFSQTDPLPILGIACGLGG